MSTIRETVRLVLDNEGYASYADHTAAWATIKALEEREDTIIARIEQHALFTDNDAGQFLIDIGLAERAPEPEPTPEAPMTTEQRLNDLVGVVDHLTDMVTRLANAATRNGITV